MSITRRSLSYLLLSPLAGWGQQDDVTPLFKTSISLIKVDVKVSTRAGNDIGGLSAEDFVVFDEAEPQKISYFARESDPIDVLLVLDVSASMRRSLAQLSEKSAEALGQLRSGDRAGVLLFATTNELVQPLSEDMHATSKVITNSIYKGRFGNTTLVNEALLEAGKYLRSSRAGARRAVVVVTDNEVSRQDVTDVQVVRQMQASDAVLSAILVGTSITSPRGAGRYQNPASAPPDMFRFAQATGGDVITGEDPGAALRKLIRSTTTRYSVQYSAPGGDPGSFRKIRVELSPAMRRRYPDAVIQARDGYQVAN